MRFAFITPRYGADHISGAEHACRLLAQQVSERHDVEVLTTSASDPETWKNEYSEGADRIRRRREVFASERRQDLAGDHLAPRRIVVGDQGASVDPATHGVIADAE